MTADETPLEARIRAIHDTLTPSERRLAGEMLALGDDLTRLTAAELAARSETSQATAARFFQRLGYAGWADLRGRLMRGSPFEALLAAGGAQVDLERHLAQETANLTRSFAELAPGAIDAAAGILAGAGRIRVIGFRNSRTLAAHARALLVHLHPDVQAIPLAGMTLAEEAAALGPGDAVLAFGFRRRPRALSEFLAIARDAGAPVVLIADPTAVAPVRLATVSLLVRSEAAGPFDSYVAAMSLLTFLAARVTERLGPSARDRLARIEALHERLDGPGSPD